MILWALACAGFAAWASLAVVFATRAARMIRLTQVPPRQNPPPLAVVVAARNEAAAVEPAMHSLLALDYPDLRIVAVDDRSSDETGVILDRLADESGRLTVIHVRELPPGWLGKNHALQTGASAVDTPWILFTDADVHFSPDALTRAVALAESENLDHLVLFPEVIAPQFWERLFVTFFGVLFAANYRPWEVSNPKSRAFVGVGAFNLVRTEAYRRMGGHAALPLEVADDVKLGKKLKQSGGRALCAAADGLVRVRWITGLRGAVEGLAKNLFAGLGFRPERVIGAGLAIAALVVWPGAGLWFGPPGARLLCAAALAAMCAAAAAPGLVRSPRPLYGLLFPLAAVIFIYTLLRSMWKTYQQGGVVWRGTLYPLSELRKGVV